MTNYGGGFFKCPFCQQVIPATTSDMHLRYLCPQKRESVVKEAMTRLDEELGKILRDH